MARSEKIGQLKKEQCFELSVEWEIADFVSLSQEVDSFYTSALFQFLGRTWYLRIYPNGHSNDIFQGYIGLYLILEGSTLSKCLTYTFHLKTSSGVKEELFCGKGMFKKDFGGGDWGRNHVLQRSNLLKQKSKFLPSNVLTVICTLKYVSDSAEVTEHVEDQAPNNQVEASSQTEATNCIDKLQKEFQELLLSGKNSDVTLNVKGKEFAAHRNILAARSPVFSAMMEHEMREQNTGVIEIEDSDPDTFPDFLQYLYTGRVKSLTSEKALNLYTTADKYQVNELKAVCLENMLDNISVENFCGLLTLSLRHHEKNLLDRTTQFFIENSLEIVMTPKWQTFMVENPVESNELLIKSFRVKN